MMLDLLLLAVAGGVIGYGCGKAWQWVCDSLRERAFWRRRRLYCELCKECRVAK